MKCTWLVWAFCGLAAVTSYAQQSPVITVRVIDTSSDKPVPHREIWIYRINPKTHMPIAEKGFPLRGSTDADGKVSFSSARLSPSLNTKSNGEVLSAPRKLLSKFLDIEIVYGSAGKQCSRGVLSLNEILAVGVVDEDRCNKKFDPARFKTVPGEVIFFVGKYHWWEAGET